MIRDRERITARLVSRLCRAGQRFIRLHRILDASQFLCKACGKEETIFERHTLLTSFSASRRISASDVAVPLSTRLSKSAPACQGVPFMGNGFEQAFSCGRAEVLDALCFFPFLLLCTNPPHYAILP